MRKRIIEKAASNNPGNGVAPSIPSKDISNKGSINGSIIPSGRNIFVDSEPLKPDAGTNPRSRELYENVGISGLTRFGIHVYEEWLPQLQGAAGMRVLREMLDNDAVIGAVMFAITSVVRQIDWKITPKHTKKRATKLKKFVESNFFNDRFSFNEVVCNAITMLGFGWSWQEITYMKNKQGQLVWKSFTHINQETLYGWQFDTESNAIGLIQLAPPDYKLRTIPVEKSVHFRTTSAKNNPEGRTIFRNSYRSWFFKKNMEEIEAIGTERDLVGLPVMEVPVELLTTKQASDEQRTLLSQLKKMITNVRRDQTEGIMIPAETLNDGNPSGYKFRLASSGGTRAFDTDKIIKRYEYRIASTALADFILLGQDSVGSFALASSKTNLFSLAIKHYADIIKTEFNTNAIPKLCKLNGYTNEDDFPQLDYNEIATPDLNEVGKFVAALSAAGATLFPDVELENSLRERARLPIKTEEVIEEQKKLKQENENSEKEEINPIESAKRKQKKRDNEQARFDNGLKVR